MDVIEIEENIITSVKNVMKIDEDNELENSCTSDSTILEFMGISDEVTASFEKFDWNPSNLDRLINKNDHKQVRVVFRKKDGTKVHDTNDYVDTLNADIKNVGEVRLSYPQTQMQILEKANGDKILYTMMQVTAKNGDMKPLAIQHKISSDGSSIESYLGVSNFSDVNIDYAMYKERTRYFVAQGKSIAFVDPYNKYIYDINSSTYKRRSELINMTEYNTQISLIRDRLDIIAGSGSYDMYEYHNFIDMYWGHYPTIINDINNGRFIYTDYGIHMNDGTSEYMLFVHTYIDAETYEMNVEMDENRKIPIEMCDFNVVGDKIMEQISDNKIFRTVLKNFGWDENNGYYFITTDVETLEDTILDVGTFKQEMFPYFKEAIEEENPGYEPSISHFYAAFPWFDLFDMMTISNNDNNTPLLNCTMRMGYYDPFNNINTENKSIAIIDIEKMVVVKSMKLIGYDIEYSGMNISHTTYGMYNTVYDTNTYKYITEIETGNMRYKDKRLCHPDTVLQTIKDSSWSNNPVEYGPPVFDEDIDISECGTIVDTGIVVKKEDVCKFMVQ